MASTISSVDLSGLAPTFQTAIKSIIEAESAPLKQVQTRRDQLDVRRSVFTDVKTNFDALQSAAQALISTQASFGLSLVAKASVTPLTSGSTVLTASLTDESIPSADYDFSVIKLAKAQSRAAAAVSSPDIALNKSGTFWLGGTGTAALQTETSPGVFADFVPSTSVTAATTTAVASSQRELGQGLYNIQVRDQNGVRQFRLVDADGNAVSIRSTDGTSTYTSNWQKMVDGSYDTGRGQSLTLISLGDLGSTAFHYTARGTSINISATDTQRTIVNAINNAAQPEGHDFRASIVANQLVLTSAQTGENHAMIYTDGANLGLNTLLQAAQNAQFKVNGMTVTRSSNANLKDVVEGVTLNLAADAEGKDARLSINASADKAAGLMSTMVSKFNTALTHLKDKLASTAKTEGDKTTYTRGPLSGDTIFSGLRTDLLYRMSRSYKNSGSFQRLEEIGLSFDKDMKLTFDSAKFSEAFKNNNSDVAALLDAGMGEINTLLSRYTGSNGYLSTSLTSMDNQRKDYDQRITKYNDSLTLRQQSLYKQYLEYQNQLADLGRQAQMFGIDLGSNVNKSG
ncbi:MAG TPA: flagellar filament capping protein FliD [Anaerolineales bacterium]|nr:flagellar filament capping protein FliD [Anaerolineales bacterium]